MAESVSNALFWQPLFFFFTIMHGRIRPTLGSDDDDLERMQQEFLTGKQRPAASVKRKGPSLFAQRRQQQQQSQPLAEDADTADFAGMPTLESVPAEAQPEAQPEARLEPAVEDDRPQFVADPHGQHTPATKTMLDLSSLLGNVLGAVTENTVDAVAAPTLPTRSGRSERSDQHAQGFPKPARRSRFKEQQLKKKQQPDEPAMAEPPALDVGDENMSRLDAMSEQELEEARQDVLSQLSPESISILLNRSKKPTASRLPSSAAARQTAQEQKAAEQAERDKLAWMDASVQPPPPPEAVDEQDSVYRRVRFDLQGNIIDASADIPRHKGLHHHGDEPDKAGYTLAELFYLVRSTVASQRAMVLTTLARILWRAKSAREEPVWADILRIFRRPDIAASIYLRSALDDRHLIVLVSAVQALAALVLPNEAFTVSEVLKEAYEKCGYAGHLARPILPRSDKDVKPFGDKFTQAVKSMQGQPGEEEEEEEENDAQLAERDLARGLVKMNLLQRIKYLLSPDSELLTVDGPSVELLLRVLAWLAEAGPDVCEDIMRHDLLEPTLAWGLVNKPWPMTEDGSAHHHPSLAALRLLTVLSQSSKAAAERIMDSSSACLLPLLAVSPDAACGALRGHAYALQMETLALMRVQLCYGLVTPTLPDLHEPMMTWIKASLALKTEQDWLRGAATWNVLQLCLNAAADPHKTTPAHAIEWHQPAAFLPLAVATLRTSSPASIRPPSTTALCSSHDVALAAALGYLATWAMYMDRFPPVDDTMTTEQVWQAAVKSEPTALATDQATVRYMELVEAVSKSQQQGALAAEARSKWTEPTLVEAVRRVARNNGQSQEGVLGRIAMGIWLDQVKDRSERMRLWHQGGYELAELESVVGSMHAGAAEKGLAQQLLQLCVLTRLSGDLASVLAPFYAARDDDPLDSLMFPRTPVAPLNVTAWLMSPLVEAPAATLQAAAELTQDPETLDHDVTVICLMQAFLSTDFWDPSVRQWLDHWLDVVCVQPMEGSSIEGFEAAWRRTSAEGTFYPFYQAFVAHYAAESMGHPGFGRLLAYVSRFAGMDCEILLWSDYADVLKTIRVPRGSVAGCSDMSRGSTLLRAYLAAVRGKQVSREAGQDGMYWYALQLLKHNHPSNPTLGTEEWLQRDKETAEDWQQLSL